MNNDKKESTKTITKKTRQNRKNKQQTKTPIQT